MIVEGKYVEIGGVYRPFLNVLIKYGSFAEYYPFLLDTGADKTFLPFEFIKILSLDTSEIDVKEDISGIGGTTPYFLHKLDIIIGKEEFICFKGEVGIFLDPHSAPFPILGRDILDNFKLIFDREKDKIYLLDERHTYEIKEMI